MPTIVLPNTQVDGDPADAAEVSQNLYTPNAATAASLAAINGVLDKDNLDPAEFPLTHDVVRRDAYAGGDLVGATANQDFFSDWFRGTKNSGAYGETRRTKDDIAVPIPGASITFRLPVPVSVLYIKWQISLISDGLGKAFDTQIPPSQFFTGTYPSNQRTRLTLWVDGRRVTQYTQDIIGSRATLGDRAQVKYEYPNDSVVVDHREWTGVAAFYPGGPFDDLLALVAPLELRPYGAGFHTAELRINHAGSQARVKVRNMSYRYVR